MKIEAIPTLKRGVHGTRAVIEFSPKVSSTERLVAGVVTKLTSGEISFTCSIDERKASHAFGPEGTMLYSIAHKLCESLALYWSTSSEIDSWTPPFVGATICDASEFTSSTASKAQELMLNRVSAISTLLSHYTIAHTQRSTGIVQRIKTAVRQDKNAAHLLKRFNRELTVAGEALPLKVDFLGVRYACYFLQISRAVRGLDGNTDRAYGKLFELQALEKFIKTPRQSLGLLDEERPNVFELVLVGDRKDPIQKQAINQIEALADRDNIGAHIESNAENAAKRVVSKERLVA
jgi:hypothetical protein